MTKSFLLSLSQISPEAFKAFGIEEMAYIKPVKLNDGHTTVYSVHAADGTPLSLMNEKEIARATLIQNDLAPQNIH